jgi:hypothetical protein
MKTTIYAIRGRATAFCVAFALAALAASPAQAGATASQADVLGQRAQAQAALSPQIERARAQAQAREELEAALTKRGRALNRTFAETIAPTASERSGFSWTDAGVGAGMAFGLMLAAAGVAFGIRRIGRPVSGLS